VTISNGELALLDREAGTGGGEEEVTAPA